MAATPEQIQAARKRYKNRKKTIRVSYQVGAIDAVERQQRLDEAWQAFCQTAGQQHWKKEEQRQRAAVATNYLLAGSTEAKSAKSAIQQGSCNEECVGARSYFCRCACKGVNHGAAYGTEPHQVKVKGMTIAERIKAGVLDPDAVAQSRLAAAGLRERQGAASDG